MKHTVPESGQRKLNFRGISRKPGEPPSFETIRKVCVDAIEYLNNESADIQVDRSETIGFLTMVRDLTEEADPGFFYCPYYPALNFETILEYSI